MRTDWKKGSGNNDWSPFWIYTKEGLQLSPYCNWQFYYLDESYQKAFGGSLSTTTPHRSPLYVYSNAGQSMVTGNQVTDLLREIPHSHNRMTYEPRHILYRGRHGHYRDVSGRERQNVSGLCIRCDHDYLAFQT